MLPTFKLGSKFGSEALADLAFNEVPHKNIEGGTVYTVEVVAGDILLTTYNRILQNTIYQTPSRFPWTRKRKFNRLFNLYSNGHEWTEFMVNYFGKVFKRSDEKAGALTSHLMDYTTFHTEFWRSKKW